jgi:16S rRNA (cytosine967-C5)-methyltransferase
MQATLVSLVLLLSTAYASPTLARAFVATAEVIGRVLDGENLNAALGEIKHRASATSIAAAAQDLCYNTLRGYGVVDVALERLLDKPLHDSRLRGLLLAAIAELTARPHSAHAIVHQAVEAAGLLGRSRAKGLVNAVMRSFQRRAHPLLSAIEATEPGRYRHPQWWIDLLRATYPHDWEAVISEANRHPPMVLRVNQRRLSAGAYLEKLDRAGIPARWLGQAALLLEKPCRVERLPGFAAGEVSVQDAGAQRAALLLDVREGMRVLDACAAPGGKTGHILELARCELLAVDADGARARRITENLSRLKLAAEVVIWDCREPDRFSGGKPFDRILLDAPCSASGVVRRHPDIKWARRRADVPAFARIQGELLDALWSVLATGGKLLYATCSVFPEENGCVVHEFLLRHPDAEMLPLPGLTRLDSAKGEDAATLPGRAPHPEGQILPGPDSDGFFYALLIRTGR